jgi:3-hydroxyisobutyrate dehydrogenase
VAAHVRHTPLVSRSFASVTAAKPPTVLGIGLGNIGAPLSARIAAEFPTTVFDLDEAAAVQHAVESGSTATIDLPGAALVADIIFTCLPNTKNTQAVLDIIRPSLSAGQIWIDATSGHADDAAALAVELWAGHGVRYLDCAVSGGPAGARKGILAALVGSDDASAFTEVEPILSTFSDKITYLGPAGSGHLVKAVNNALLGAQMLVASEGLACIARKGVDVHRALQAINGSSGRSWVTMQRFPDNILTGDPYGFSLGMHIKDMNNALQVVNEGGVEAPMLEEARRLMEVAAGEWGAQIDHTDTSRLAARRNDVDFEKLPR